MLAARSWVLLCALALVAVLAGCGSSGTPAGKSPTTTHTTSTVPLAVKIREAIAACRKQVSKSPYIPVSEKPAAQTDCNGIKKGNISSLKAILRQACLNAVAKLPAADQPPASAACNKVY